MAETSTSFQLTERDQKILEHIARYRMGLREIVQQLFMPEAEMNAVTKVLSRLVRAGLVAKHKLHDARCYWTLSAKSASQRGLHEKRSYALGYEAEMQHYGVLAYCCGGKAQRHLLTPSEFEAQFPGHASPHITRTAYYIDEHEGVRRLGLILVDSGQKSYVRLLRKCRVEIQRRVELPAFRDRIRDGGLVIAIVTGSEDFKKRLEKALSEEQSKSVLYRVVLRRGLAQLWVNRARRSCHQPRPD